MSVGVLFVCLGNICRSPTAQGVMQRLVEKRGLCADIRVDSAGTAAFNVGKSPDARAIAACEQAGLDISCQIARQIDDEDYRRYHYIIAMDRQNLVNCQTWAPKDFGGEIRLMLDYVPGRGSAQVADPYYADSDAFAGVVSELDHACEHLLEYIIRANKLAPAA